MALDWKKTSDWWYAKLTVNGKVENFNLDLKIEGERPAKINDVGPGVDQRFIESRAKARLLHDQLRESIKSNTNLEELYQKLIELKTGSRMESVKLTELSARWRAIPRKKAPNEDYATACQKILERFAAFMAQNWPMVKELASVTRDHTTAFLEEEQKRGETGKTRNAGLKVLRAIFRHYQPEADAYRKHLVAAPLSDVDTIHRKPYTPDELERITKSAANDEFTRPLIVTALCTAMRRHDVCCLKWTSIDLAGRNIRVKAFKTKEPIWIPIFPLLFDELLKRKDNGSEFVFPEQATMYEKNPDGITWRAKKILATALRVDGGDRQPAVPQSPTEEIIQKADAYLAALRNREKSGRMKVVLGSYLDRVPCKKILEAHGIKKGTLFGYLNEIQAKTGCRIIRGRDGGQGLSVLLKTDSSLLRKERAVGKRRASVHDFHSFRVTWVTLALTAGVPIEIVRKVTGHKTVEVVLANYFQPNQEDFRRALETTMPALMMKGALSRKEQLQAIIESITSKSLKADKARAIEFLLSAF